MDQRVSFRLVLAAGLLLSGPAAASAQERALEIIRAMEDLTRGVTQVGTYSLVIVRPDWERTLTFEVWSEGTERSFIRINAPAKERGVSFLKIGREMWQYVPRISRVIKIPPSMMMQSWMGSGFTNDDLVRESSLVTDYVHTLVETVDMDGAPAYHIALVTRPEAPVAWARVAFWVRVEDYVPLRAEFFNERGERVRTMTYHDIRTIGGRTVPGRMELVEDRWPDRKTIMITESAQFDVAISDDIFSQANLRRHR